MLLKAYKAARYQNKISDRSDDCRPDMLCLNDFMTKNGMNQNPDITLSGGHSGVSQRLQNILTKLEQ